jgi:hypothetical protein
MAKVNQRPWRAPGQRAKRKAWGFTVQVDGKQKRVYGPSGPRRTPSERSQRS